MCEAFFWFCELSHQPKETHSASIGYTKLVQKQSKLFTGQLLDKQKEGTTSDK